MFYAQTDTSHGKYATSYDRSPAIKLKRTWLVTIDGDHVSLLEKPLMKGLAFLPSFSHAHDGMNIERANEHLESALAAGKFDTLMLVGDAEDLYRFRGTLKESVRRRVVAEVQRPNRDTEFLDERLQEMYA